MYFMTNEFSCAQTVSLIVSDFIVLVVMVVALVFSTSIWHHKFKAMEKVMKHTLDVHKKISLLDDAPRQRCNGIPELEPSRPLRTRKP